MKYYVIDDDEGQRWYLDPEFTVLHRDGDKPAIIAGGDQYWYQDGKRHRANGPAVVFPGGHQAWYQHGKRHREDGPAMVHVNGACEWYINGQEYSEAEFNAKINPVKELTVAEIEALLGYKVKVVNKV